MKKMIVLVLLTLSISATYAIELGIILGEPTGISFRQWHGKSLAMDFQLGWSMKGNDDKIDIHGAYLFHSKTQIRIENSYLLFYYGPGGRVKFDKSDNLVVNFKFPLGLYHKFKSIPFSISGELSPSIKIIPDTDFELLGGISFRYIF